MFIHVPFLSMRVGNIIRCSCLTPLFSPSQPRRWPKTVCLTRWTTRQDPSADATPGRTRSEWPLASPSTSTQWTRRLTRPLWETATPWGRSGPRYSTISLHHVKSTNIELVGFKTCTATSHQGAIHILGFTLRAVMLSILINNHWYIATNQSNNGESVVKILICVSSQKQTSHSFVRSVTLQQISCDHTRHLTQSSKHVFFFLSSGQWVACDHSGFGQRLVELGGGGEQVPHLWRTGDQQEGHGGRVNAHSSSSHSMKKKNPQTRCTRTTRKNNATVMW